MVCHNLCSPISCVSLLCVFAPKHCYALCRCQCLKHGRQEFAGIVPACPASLQPYRSKECPVLSD